MNILSDSTLPLSEWIEYTLTDVLSALGKVNARLQTDEGRPLRWMDPLIECAFADTDRILATLEGKDHGDSGDRISKKK